MRRFRLLGNDSGGRLAILFLIIGTIGGAVGGGGAGVYIGRRTQPARQPQPAPPRPPALPASTPQATTPPGDSAPRPGLSKDGGTAPLPDGGTDPSDTKWCLEIRDPSDHPVVGALVSARPLAPPPASGGGSDG